MDGIEGGSREPLFTSEKQSQRIARRDLPPRCPPRLPPVRRETARGEGLRGVGPRPGRGRRHRERRRVLEQDRVSVTARESFLEPSARAGESARAPLRWPAGSEPTEARGTRTERSAEAPDPVKRIVAHDVAFRLPLLDEDGESATGAPGSSTSPLVAGQALLCAGGTNDPLCNEIEVDALMHGLPNSPPLCSRLRVLQCDRDRLRGQQGVDLAPAVRGHRQPRFREFERVHDTSRLTDCAQAAGRRSVRFHVRVSHAVPAFGRPGPGGPGRCKGPRRSGIRTPECPRPTGRRRR